MKLDEFLKMPPEARRKVRVRRKPRGCYLKRKFTAAEVTEYLRSHNYRSVRQLRAGRKQGEPNLHVVNKTHGSFAKAKEAAFGIDHFDIAKRPDAMHIVKAVLEFDLWERDRYQAFRKMHPTAVPSLHWVRVHYGSWDRAKWAAEQLSSRKCLERWLSLTRRLGRAPTLDEINANQICLDPLRKIHKTNAQLMEYLDGIAKLALSSERT